MPKYYKLLAILVTFIMVQNIAYAQVAPFVTNYGIDYKVDATGKALIDQNISIENTEKDVVATEYSLNIKKMNIFNPSATAKNTDIELTEQNNKNETNLNLKFEDTVIGKGRSNVFNVKYETYDIASKVGEVWNINIPRVYLLETTNRYDVKLHVPKSFGPEIFISPEPLLKEDNENNIIYTFNINSLTRSGISASFGEYQILNFKLHYNLVNESYFNSIQTITLPPDLEKIQQIAYKNLSPSPTKIYRDSDGNILAEYNLDSKENLDITLIGTAKIISRQINPKFGGKLENIPSDLKSSYTEPSIYWNSDSEQIKKIANSLFNPNETVTQNAQKAYDFVTQELQYDFEILNQDYVERKGGLEALTNPMQIGCMEYTDLFISIVRAMGIPARELNGYAIVNDNAVSTPLSINLKGGDLLHSWTEFYDPEFGWVPVDPTWGSTSEIDYFTKLDTNHLVFAVKGVSPFLPKPAGTFKTKDTQKQVYVDFAEDTNVNDFYPELKYYKGTTLNPISHLKKEQKYYVKNEGAIVVKLDKYGTELLPTDIKSITLKNPSEEIYVKDTLGKDYVLNPTYSDENLDNPIKIYAYAILAVLGLCAIYYVLLVHLQVLNKVFRHLSHRPRDQDR